jgi:hypothetical protein
VAYWEIARRGFRLAARTARDQFLRRDSEQVIGCLRESGWLAYELGYRNADRAARRGGD